MSRNWDQLSANYQRRLARQGITKEQYESGAALARARGHSSTPERPADAARHPDRYAAYLNKNPNAGRRFPVFPRQADEHGPLDLRAYARWTIPEKSILANHWNAIRQYLYAGEDTSFNDLFAPFQTITVGGRRGIPKIRLETRQHVINRYLQIQHLAPFETLYEYAQELA